MCLSVVVVHYRAHIGSLVHACMLSCVWLFVTPWTVACQAPLSVWILQARILEWSVISFSRGSSQPRDWTHVSCIAGGFLPLNHLGTASGNCSLFIASKSATEHRLAPLILLLGIYLIDIPARWVQDDMYMSLFSAVLLLSKTGNNPVFLNRRLVK